VAWGQHELHGLAADGGDAKDFASEEPPLRLCPFICLETLYFFEGEKARSGEQGLPREARRSQRNGAGEKSAAATIHDAARRANPNDPS